MIANRFILGAACFASLLAPLTLVGCGGKGNTGPGTGGDSGAKTPITDASDFYKSDAHGKHGDTFTEVAISDPKTLNPILVK